MADDSVIAAMRSDWDQRAGEDANYYVAFGRRNQSEQEFFASAADQVRLFETEMKRRPPEFWKHSAALEIGCGPGRLLHPLSRHFRTLHGVDISAAMLQRAAANLSGIGNVTLHHAADSTLSSFPAESIAFVYSYAVFQHIPSEQIVLGYLAEAVRVLTPGGLFVFQINGLPDRGHVPSTWEGCSISAETLAGFARASGLLLLALTDKDTQYMWVTLQKPFPSSARPPLPTRIFQVTNAYTGEPVVPASGRFGAASVWMTDLPDKADLLTLGALVDGAPAYCCYVSPPNNGRRFLDILMPPSMRTGLLPIELLWQGLRLCEPAMIRCVPPGPKIPSVAYVADGINLLSADRIVSGCVKMVMDEVADPASLRIGFDGVDLAYDWFCINPLHERYEFNFRIPPSAAAGKNVIRLQVGGKQFAPIPIEIADPS